MPTSINIPPDLLDRIDRAAQRRGLSRSQYIASILEHAVERDEDWPRFFFDVLIESAMKADAKRGA
jgi:metal-responsive CopG/Arc/MetJ family transcriptional regulator